MASQTSCETLKSIAGSVLAGAGLFVLRGTVEEVAQLSQLQSVTAGEGLGLWHFVRVAASLSRYQVGQGVVEILVALLSLLVVMAGAELLWSSFEENSKSVAPGGAAARDSEPVVFLRRCMPFGSGNRLPENEAVVR
jgi:hypothetical protein